MRRRKDVKVPKMEDVANPPVNGMDGDGGSMIVSYE